jgi:hypothetical protein
MNLRIPVFSVFLASSLFAALPNGNEWRTYVDLGGFYKINYPPGWQVLSKGNAVVITSPGDAGERGVFGITPRARGLRIEEAVEQEFSDPERSSDLQKTAARLGNQPAIKVWGSKKGDPNTRIVEYYVQRGNNQYYILFQAPHASMDRYSGVFNKMIASMKFLQ